MDGVLNLPEFQETGTLRRASDQEVVNMMDALDDQLAQHERQADLSETYFTLLRRQEELLEIAKVRGIL